MLKQPFERKLQDAPRLPGPDRAEIEMQHVDFVATIWAKRVAVPQQEKKK